MNVTENSVKNCLEYRRSLRNFHSRMIEEPVLEDILRAAMQAPTAAGLQLYSILVIKNPDVKKVLAQSCNHQPWIANAPVLLVFCADYQRIYDYYMYSQVPDACAACNIPFLQPQEQTLLLAECDAMIAAQNAVIMAQSLGIGSCYIGHIMDHYEMHRDLFQLPRYVFPVTMLAMGYPKNDRKVLSPSPRFSSRYLVFQETYRRLNEKELEDCFGRFPTPPDRNPYHAQNRGQYHYLRRHMNSNCYEEGIRSVKAALTQWC